MPTIVAVDIGGTQMRAAAYTQDKIHPIKQKKIPTLASTPGGLDRLIKVIEDVWPKNDSVIAIGLGSPGPLDPHTGYLLAPPNNPEWHNFPLAPRCREAFRRACISR
jgi:glucokinase